MSAGLDKRSPYLGFVPADDLGLLRTPAPDSRFIPVRKNQNTDSTSHEGANSIFHLTLENVKYADRKAWVFDCYRSKEMWRVLRWVETMGEVSLWAVFSCDGCMAARREGASRGDSTSGSVYTTCFSWSTSITTAPSSTNKRARQIKQGCDSPLVLLWVHFFQSHTSTLENIAAPSFQPSHVFKAQEGGVNAEAWAAFPNPVDVTGTNLWNQGDWNKRRGKQEWRGFKSKSAFKLSEQSITSAD